MPDLPRRGSIRPPMRTADDDEEDLDWEEWDGTGSFVHHCIAGSFAGIAEHTLMYPMDTIRTHMQCENCQTPKACPKNASNFGKEFAETSIANKRMSIIQTMRSVVGNEAAQGSMFRLWRGVHTMFIGCVPAHALYFSAYEVTKKQFGADQPGHHPAAAAASGAISTFFHDMIMSPLDTVKQRLQLGYYSGLSNCVRTMHKTEGISSFYRSFPTTLTMNIPYGCVMFASNESLKKLINPQGGFDLKSSILAGVGAGAIAAAFTNPLDVVKTRLQTQQLGAMASTTNFSSTASTTTTSGMRAAPQVAMLHTSKNKTAPCAKEAEMIIPRYAGGLDCLKSILRAEGVGGLFKGLTPRVVTHAPAVAISWTTYESIKNWIS